MSFEPENPSADLGQDAQAYLFREFEKISDETALAVDTGEGNLFRTSTTPMSGTITTTPTKIPVFDAKIDEEIAFQANIANNTITLEETGIWFVFFKIVYLVNSSSANNTRTIYFDLWDETNNAQFARVTSAAIARYQTEAVGVGFAMRRAKLDDLGLEIAIYASGSESIAYNDVGFAEFGAFRVSDRNVIKE